MPGRRRALFAGGAGEIRFACSGTESSLTGRNLNPPPTVDCAGPVRRLGSHLSLGLWSFCYPPHGSRSCAWLIGRASKQRGLLPRLLRASPPSARARAVVTVIVPARDEEANIGPCLQVVARAGLSGKPACSILVVDDHSTDATAAIVRELAARHPHVSLLQAPPLPPRWTGKSHACWIGVRSAVPQTQWLCFIDADVRARAGALSSAMRAAATSSSIFFRWRRARSCEALPSG